jgi:hypothetical protein
VPVRLGSIRKRGDQRRLADARLAADHHDLTAFRRLGRSKRGFENLKLGPSTHEHRRAGNALLVRPRIRRRSVTERRRLPTRLPRRRDQRRDRDVPGAERPRCELRVVNQDRLPQVGHRLARIDAQLLTQEVSQAIMRTQGVGLSTRSIQRQHPQRPQPLAVGMVRDQRPQLYTQSSVSTEDQLSMSKLLERHEPEFVQSGHLGTQERLVGQLAERRSLPQRERLREQLASTSGVSNREL